MANRNPNTKGLGALLLRGGAISRLLGQPIPDLPSPRPESWFPYVFRPTKRRCGRRNVRIVSLNGEEGAMTQASGSSAARSLEEGLEETLTVHRLGIGVRERRWVEEAVKDLIIYQKESFGREIDQVYITYAPGKLLPRRVREP